MIKAGLFLLLHTESHWNLEMIVVILLFSAVYSQKKPDFGALTACVTKNQSLTVDCYYPPCDNTPFYCSLYDDHAKIYHNQTKTYVCALSRRTSEEEKTLIVKYTGKKRPKDCPGTGLFLLLHTESHWNLEMIVVILLFSAVYSQKKPDFGALTACVTKNQSLTVDCYYPPCDNTPFYCSLYDDHAKIYHNQTKTYVCALSRRTSEEEKTLIVKYTGKKRPKDCPGNLF
ncbi:uncharacterized protein LOC107677516 [Sinocyclocheilus anshuiensis]|uniref:uncharacterized protein LOC107677516 n=1 Tax=Sinocyclocheilus anshuiensis TaxID=1608454 RepID=UPI0007B8740C|nr:PREDICTED: uncharacterized protein LOC107677516 [Sinocyclocheilus anshuiensis]